MGKQRHDLGRRKRELPAPTHRRRNDARICEHAAIALVRRGLASPSILDNTHDPRRNFTRHAPVRGRRAPMEGNRYDTLD